MSRRTIALAALIGLATFSPVFAQNDPNGGGQNPPAQGPGGQGGQGGQGPGGQQGQGGRGNRGNWNPEEFRKRMLERMKEELKSPDEEWQVLQPKLEKVMTAMAEARFGGMGMGGRGGFGGPGGPGGGRGGRGGDANNGGQPAENESEFQVASRELRTVLANDNASADEIMTRLKAFREAREKSEAKLHEAQKELQAVVTERQEAWLVMRGMLQ
jgi:Spy/CpxP family protein refolding chaperone